MVKTLFSTINNRIFNILLSAIWYLSAVGLGISLTGYFDISFGIGATCILLLVVYLFERKHSRKNILPFLLYILIIPLGVCLGLALVPVIEVANIHADIIWRQLVTIFLPIFMTYTMYEIGVLLVISIKSYLAEKARFIVALFLSLGYAFPIFIGIPVSTMLQNGEDYCFSVYRLVGAEFTGVICAVLILIFIYGLCVEKNKYLANASFMSLSIIPYFQYLFLNVFITSINGTAFKFTNHIIFSLIDILIWIVLFGGIYIIVKKFDLFMIRMSIGIGSFIILLQFVAIGASIIGASDTAYKDQLYYYDGAEQYTVSASENVIVFVLDAVDNAYMDGVLADNINVFDDYNDFTMYTNTCGLYSLTNECMPQMFTGADFSSHVDYPKFYNRLKDNGYTINFYNYDDKSGTTKVNNYIDNYRNIDIEDASNMISVDYKSILSNSVRLSLYQTLPDVLKGLTRAESIDFLSQVYYSFYDFTPIVYENDDFYNNLNLKVNENSDHYFIMQHIDGSHDPISFDTYEEQTSYCFMIVAEYIRQLKELGLYDQATIIITSDHGSHNTGKNMEIKAATPIFMIKAPFEHHESMELTSAPEYHTDFLKTILVTTGLYYEEDGDRFGYSVFDFDENSERVRTWYNRGGEKKYAAYSFTGDREDLYNAVINDQYEELF